MKSFGKNINRDQVNKTFTQSNKESNNFSLAVIDDFLGHSSSPNILKMPFGQLIYNQNMEYIYSQDVAYLRTKRGSTLIKDITNRAYGAGVFTYNFTDSYFCWVDSLGTLWSSTTTGTSLTSLKTALKTGVQNHMVPFGASTASCLYIANNTDGLFKVSGSTPAYSLVDATVKLDCMAYSTSSGRMVGAYENGVWSSDIQTAETDLTNLENWTKQAIVSPGNGTGFKACAEVNEVMCLFKNTGVWGLINANESTANWSFPKLTQSGTKSPKTVQVVQYGNQTREGIIYLATNKTLRYLDVFIERNSGTLPNISIRNSYDIGKNFQNQLDLIPDGMLSECSGVYLNGIYKLNFATDIASQIDITINIDTFKMLPLVKGEIIPQPYWYYTKNCNFTDYAISPDSILYGFSIDGYISQLFVNDKYHEEAPTRVSFDESTSDDGTTRSVAIEWVFYTGWWKYNDQELRLKGSFINWNIDGSWSVTLKANGFSKGQTIPDFTQGVSTTIKTPTVGLSYYDISAYDVATFAGSTQGNSTRRSLNIKGHYFLFGMSHTTLDQWASIYSIEPIFELNRPDQVGSR